MSKKIYEVFLNMRNGSKFAFFSTLDEAHDYAKRIANRLFMDGNVKFIISIGWKPMHDMFDYNEIGFIKTKPINGNGDFVLVDCRPDGTEIETIATWIQDETYGGDCERCVYGNCFECHLQCMHK